MNGIGKAYVNAKKSIKRALGLFVMTMFITLLISNSALATAEYVDLQNVNPAWLSQQLVLQINGTTWALNVNLLSDPTAMDTFLNGVNTQLAAYTVDVLGEDGTTRKMCYQLNDEFRSWLVTNLQARLSMENVGTIVVDLADNHMKIIIAPMAVTSMEGYSLAGGCETSYSTSSSNRCNNVEIAAAHLNNYVVQPGQVVSVSDAILPRTTANGYKEAGAYENGETVSAIGGGICQVSSTIYNAVMNAGLTVIERHPHSMPVHYLPLGQDAAISQGSLDMRFRNDYDTPVVIQAQTVDKKLTITVYVQTSSLQGRSYRFWSERTGDLSATSYLTTSVNGVEVQTVKVANSKYRPHVDSVS
ncbi:MAG: VanW family protein [Lachnospiraceae bacterium]|nr:VanW family protein [Lachnospiraceae bacterium]